MKKMLLVLFVVFVFSFSPLFCVTYELTETDIFSLEGVTLTSADITVKGFSLKTTAADLKKLGIKSETKKEWTFYDVEPGLRLRFKKGGNIADRIVMTDEFKSSLKGATADYFEKGKTARGFKTHVITYFGKPDSQKDDGIAALQVGSNEINYKSGFYFMRLYVKKEITLTFQLIPAEAGYTPKEKQIKEVKSLVVDGFRKCKWGMSIPEVKKIEDATYVDGNNEILVYKDTVFNMSLNVIYSFSGGKLISAGFIFKEQHTNKNDYIDDYKKIKTAFSKKYGLPVKDDVEWRQSLYKTDPEQWGFAVSLGHLKYISRWEFDNTEIFLLLYGENYKINLAAQYRSKNIQATPKSEDDKF